MVALNRDRQGEFAPLQRVPVQERLQRLEAQAAERRERVERLVVEVEELRVALARTRLAFYARAGDLYFELHSVELTLRREQFRQELAKTPGLAQAEIERLVAARFEKDAARLEELKGECARSAAEAPRAAAMAELAGETVRAMRELYRKLARRFHPDLHATDDPENRAQFESIMARVNECYRTLDLQGLLDIQDGVLINIVTVDESPEDRCLRLERVMARLERLEEECKAELECLKHHELHEMTQRMEAGRLAGRDVLAELEQDVARRIAARRRELAELRGAGGQGEAIA